MGLFSPGAGPRFSQWSPKQALHGPDDGLRGPPCDGSDGSAPLIDKPARAYARKSCRPVTSVTPVTRDSTESEIAVVPDDLDTDPFLLNCTNGTLDLRTGQLLVHDPAQLITKVTAAAHHPGEAGTVFGRF